MSKQLNRYMHTVRNMPAYFNGDQIVIFNKNHRVSRYKCLVRSLDIIKQQQYQAVVWRRKNGFETYKTDYSYIRIGGF